MTYLSEKGKTDSLMSQAINCIHKQAQLNHCTYKALLICNVKTLHLEHISSTIEKQN